MRYYDPPGYQAPVEPPEDKIALQPLFFSILILIRGRSKWLCKSLSEIAELAFATVNDIGIFYLSKNR